MSFYTPYSLFLHSLRQDEAVPFGLAWHGGGTPAGLGQQNRGQHGRCDQRGWNPRGSTLWSHPAIMEFTEREVLVLVKSVTTKKSLGARSIKASESRFNYRASPKSII